MTLKLSKIHILKGLVSWVSFVCVKNKISIYKSESSNHLVIKIEPIDGKNEKWRIKNFILSAKKKPIT